MMQSKRKNLLSRLLNIDYFVFLTTCFSIFLFLNLFRGKDSIHLFQDYFFFSQAQILKFRLWTVFSYAFLYNSIGAFLCFIIPYLLIIKKLKSFYSNIELAKIYIYTSFVASLSHLLIAPDSQFINGSVPFIMILLVLYGRLFGIRILCKVFSVKVSVNFIIFTAILIYFILSLRMQSFIGVSFSSLIGTMVFGCFLIKKENLKMRESYQKESNKSNMLQFSKALKYIKKNSFKNKHDNSNSNENLEKRVNMILDKISNNGIKSLSKEERNILDRASQSKKID